jgi:hypothetical protein
MKKTALVFFILFLAACLMPMSSWATPIFINEIHYDNAGTDVGEAIEIAGPSGTYLSGWSLVLYNGNTFNAYGSISLGGMIPDQQNGYGTRYFLTPSIQNGDPGGDGIALVDNSGTVIQFLSYGGTFTAVGGPATGLLSTDIGVAEDSYTPPGYSLQLVGTGTSYADFYWTSPPAPNSFGSINAGQTFVPIPPSLLLLGSGLLGLGAMGWRRRRIQ